MTSSDGSAGSFQLDLLVNIDEVTPATNVSFETALAIDAQFRALPFDAQLATVATEPVPLERRLIAEFDFEDGRLPANWEITATSETDGYGARVADVHGAASGTFSLLMEGAVTAENRTPTPTAGIDASLVYDPETGNVSMLVPGNAVTTLEIVSRDRLFEGETPDLVLPPFGVFEPGKLFTLDTDGMGPGDFGEILPPGLTRNDLESGFVINGSVLPRGGIKAEWLMAGSTPEPITIVAPFDLTGLAHPVLEFAHASWDPEIDPPRRTVSVTPRGADGISISLDGGSEWLPLFTPPEQPIGSWFQHSVNIGEFVKSRDEMLPDQILVAFQSQAGQPANFGGRGYDQIQMLASDAETEPQPTRETILETVSFEDGSLPADWTVTTTSTTDGIGVRVADSQPSAGGSFALLMDGETVELAVDPITNADVTLDYDSNTGNVTLIMSEGVRISTIELKSNSGIFTGTQPDLILPPFDVFRPDKFFILKTAGLGGNVDLGPIATPWTDSAVPHTRPADWRQSTAERRHRGRNTGRLAKLRDAKHRRRARQLGRIHIAPTRVFSCQLE